MTGHLTQGFGMPHQDQHAEGVRRNSVYLWQALQWLLRGVGFSHVKMRDDCRWTPRWLTVVALLWAWSDERTLTERFACAGRLAVHLRQTHAADEIPSESAGSYQAFLKLLIRWTDTLIASLQQALRQRMMSMREYWSRYGVAVFGVDGSRVELPRTKSHEAAYAPARHRGRRRTTSRGKRRKASRQKHAEGPQLWVTTMYHVWLQLPWDWRIGPSDTSERADALDMLEALPQTSVLCGDAGFVGYDFAAAVLQSGRGLLVRVGANVTLLKQLGFVHESLWTVYVWPEKPARRRPPPLVFRHVVFQGPRTPIHVIVALPAGVRLSDRQVGAIYRARWKIEVFYRQFKQTFQRRKLLSHAADNVRVEAEWSLAGLWAILLFATDELLQQGIPPDRLSAAGSLRAFRQIARDYYHPAQSTNTLRQRLRRALIDEYQRHSKTSRDYPRKKTERPPRPPNIKRASKQQQRLAQAMLTKQQKG
jgi:IS4 transposase